MGSYEAEKERGQRYEENEYEEKKRDEKRNEYEEKADEEKIRHGQHENERHGLDVNYHNHYPPRENPGFGAKKRS